MNILQINTSDFRGGAAQVMYNIKNELNKREYCVKGFVATKDIIDDDFSMISTKYKIGCLSSLSKKIIKKDLPSFIKYKSRDIFRFVFSCDIEYFICDYILNTEEFKQADIVHCHNLHGNYFNLRLLQQISKIKPVVWTLHDMWSFTGHCSYSYNCKKWQTECGNCPDLKIYPPLLWDNTKRLFKKKQRIYDNSNLNIVTPSLWLKKKVEKSILKNKSIDLIYNGVDINNLKKYNKNKIRKELNLPQNKKIIMFLAAGGKDDYRKGWKYIEKIIENHRDILFLCIGGKEKIIKNKNNVKYIKYINSKKRLAKYFSSSDIFLFTSLAENFPLVILEAMACGIPIVSFDVGGVKEAISHKENGYIVKYKDIKDLEKGINYIFSLNEDEIRKIFQKSINKVKDNFSLKIMADNYLKLYKNILNNE